MAVEARRDGDGLVRYGPVLYGLIWYDKAVEVWNGRLRYGAVG